jgi:TetR/AcrR family transcriptional repressor of nem operon
MARLAQVDETRALQAALLVFWQMGYEATPVIDLAVKMRLNRTRFYERFVSKHHLFILVLRYYQQELHRQLSAVSTDTTETIPARVRRVLELTVTIPTVDPLPQGCFLVKAGSELLPQDTEVQAVVDESQRFLESLLVALLKEGQQTGKVKSTSSPRAQAHLLSTVVAGLRVQRQLYSNPRTLHNAIELALLAIAGIRPKRQSQRGPKNL